MNTKVCIFCLKEITDKNNSREHIIPSCIGGKLQVPYLVCRDCNSYLGRDCDVELCNFLGWIACQEGLKGRSKIKYLKGIGSDRREYRVAIPDFKPILHRPYVNKRKSEKGEVWEIQASNYKELEKIVRSILRKGLKREPTDKEISLFIEQGEILNKKCQDLWISLPMNLDLRKLYRAVSKIAYQYLCYRLFLNYGSNFPLLKGLDAIRNFILKADVPNYFCSLLPRASLIEITNPHVIALFSYNNIAMAYIKLFNFEFLVNFQAYWKLEGCIIEVSKRTQELPCLSFKIRPNWGNLFPAPYILKWEFVEDKIIPTVFPSWVLQLED